MESDLQLSFSDFPEDAQLRVLSFVNRKDLKAFACTSKKFSALCTNDERLWLLKCTRRWGSRTQIPKWGGGKISYKSLFYLLKDYETLIRFWIYIYDATGLPLSSPPLLLFEWCSSYITGYRISPSKDSGYGVIKRPFIWITATCDGEGLAYLDTSNGTLSLTEEDLLREDSEKLRSTELIIAEVRTEKYDALMKVYENQDFLEFRRRLSIADGLEEYENVYSSPPDGLMAQIREALTKTVSVPIPVPDESSSKKLNSRQRRRRRREDQMMSALEWEASYFLQLHKRYDNYSRSPDQPLQGLWKGIARGKSLTFYIVTYTIYLGELSCKMAGNYVTSQINDGLVFSALMEPFIEPPFSSKEKHIYDSRLHLRPAESNQPDPTSSDVLRIFYANMGPESSAPKDPRDACGRIWLYADGSFGFGSLKDHFIIDLKPMVEDDNLLDVVM